jgi:hydroxymethylglutaryl-CoA lyase
MHDITLIDVGARDGLQNEKAAVNLPAQAKVAFIRALAACGLTRIEAGSFVHPKAVPAMANSDEVAALLAPVEAEFPDVIFSYLVPNLRGLERAKVARAKEIAIFLALSESFSKANINASVEESFTAIAPTIQAARDAGMRVRGYLSNVFGYTDLPFSPDAVAARSKQLLALGCFEVSLGDTTALGTPEMVTHVIDALRQHEVPLEHIAMHFHDTSGRAIDNVARSYALGIRSFDAATGGLGGCPYANSPKGNLAMEALVAWCSANNVGCEVHDAEGLAKAGQQIRSIIGKQAA